MASRPVLRRAWRRHLAAVAGLLAALAIGAALIDGGEPEPAPAETLAKIAVRNRDAAVTAAARMKAESEASARATDARLDAADNAAAR